MPTYISYHIHTHAYEILQRRPYMSCFFFKPMLACLHVITHLYFRRKFLELENRHALAVGNSEKRFENPTCIRMFARGRARGKSQSVNSHASNDRIFVPIRSVDVAEILIKLALTRFRPLQAISRSHDFTDFEPGQRFLYRNRSQMSCLCSSVV